jgi:hypothetical protein
MLLAALPFLMHNMCMTIVPVEMYTILPDPPEGWFGSPRRGAPTSNVDAVDLPFQRWYRFKEAFSPSFVRDVISGQRRQIRSCADPFGGSGTTALVCQFLGVRPTTIEINPFLADLITAKLKTHDIIELIDARRRLHRRLARDTKRSKKERAPLFPEAPPTFVEPGVSGRWIFDRQVARRVAQYLEAIDREASAETRALFRSLLGGALIPSSHVVISGKGRRYRRQAQQERIAPTVIDDHFSRFVQLAFEDISRYARRACPEYTLHRGDARRLLGVCEPVDLVLFSPPYPNSFDYTDIYNVELWGLGYLREGIDNRELRESTLRSHVQIFRDFTSRPLLSPTLAGSLRQLRRARRELWNRNIPEMIGAYFEDLLIILEGARRILRTGAECVLVAGDSRYAGVQIDVARVLEELAPSVGFRCVGRHAVRAMRTSAQQGGIVTLGESLIRLRRR